MAEIHVFRYNPFEENTYLIINGKRECIIIDPGCYFEDERKGLLEFIGNQDLKPVRLINTHCHLDHIFGNRLISRTYGLTPEFHRLEQPVLDGSVQAGVLYNVPFEPSPPPKNYLEEGDRISLGEDVLDILFTPGHSPGSICLYHEKQQFLIGGDVLFHQSIGRTDLPGGDYDTLIGSIREKLLPLGDDIRVYPGHGEMTTIGEERRTNPFLR
ncbi:MAG TPA: MBL fold metallo-hydrolase [Chitinophagaceae bacterium]|nr:MBL fold metallo-hydrolase [Chitinophagaceae bacterium]